VLIRRFNGHRAREVRDVADRRAQLRLVDAGTRDGHAERSFARHRECLFERKRSLRVDGGRTEHRSGRRWWALLSPCASLARTPTSEFPLDRMWRVGHHRQQMRRRAGRRPLEPRVPAVQRLGHRRASLQQSSQLFVHLFQEALACSPDRMARWTPALASLEEASELLRGESESDRISHEEEPRDGFIGVIPETAGGPGGAREDTDAFVVANEIWTDPRATSRLADSEGVAGHTPSYSLESFQVQHDSFS